MKLRDWPVRYTFLGISFLACFICFIDRVNISVAAIAMQDSFGWSDTTKGFVLSSFFIGYMVFQIPGGWLADRFGGKKVLGAALIIWSGMTLLTPLAALAGLPVLYAARIALGLGEAVSFPSAYSLFSRWALPDERSRFVALFTGGIPAGTLFALITSGWLVAYYGWESVFYIFGAAGIVFAVVWFGLVHNDPRDHPKLTAKERALFDAHRPAPLDKPKTPWRKLAGLPVFWALIINHFCVDWSFYVLLTWFPSYFHKAFGVPIVSAGLYSAAPWLVLFVMMHVGAFAADVLIRRGKDVTFVRKLVQISGLLVASAFLLIAPFAQTSEMALVIMCVATGGLGVTTAGFAATPLDIAPRYAGTVIGVSNTGGTLAGIVGVALTGWLVDRTGSFDAVWLLCAAIGVLGAVVWFFFASGEKHVD